MLLSSLRYYKSTTSQLAQRALLAHEEAEGPGAGGGYDGDEVPAEGDGPGAGGGYEPADVPHEGDGPGAGGGYDGDEVPAEGDGPGAGGGYEPADVPHEGDGPGAGGGYDGDEVVKPEKTEKFEIIPYDGPGAGGGYQTFRSSTSNWDSPVAIFSTFDASGLLTLTDNGLWLPGSVNWSLDKEKKA